MAPKAQKRSAKSSSSASSRTAVDPSVSAYTLEIYRKRNALSRLPINDSDEEDSACKGKRKAANNAESVDDIRDRIVKASKAAHWNPADGRWATVRQLLQLTCTRGRDFRWIVPEKKQSVASPPLELRLWSEQVSQLLRRKWKPRSGPEYEKELLYRAQKEWVPTESYPTRETAVVKQILEKREWEADILELVQQWLASSTQDGSTEIRVILAKKKLVDSLKTFLDALLPQDAPDAARVKNFQKEHWVTEVTHFFKQNGAPTLTRNSTSNLSVASKERKSVALHEKVKTWQQTLLVETKDRPRRASDAPSEASSSKSKTKRKETAESTTTLRKSAQPVAKQSSLEFAVSKSSANKLAGKPKGSIPRDPPRVDDDLLSNDSHHDVHIGLPSQVCVHRISTHPFTHNISFTAVVIPFISNKTLHSQGWHRPTCCNRGTCTIILACFPSTSSHVPQSTAAHYLRPRRNYQILFQKTPIPIFCHEFTARETSSDRERYCPCGG